MLGRVLAVVCLVALVSTVLAPVGPIDAEETHFGIARRSVENPRASLEPWTTEEMQAAKPAPMPKFDPSDRRTRVERGEPLLIAGSGPISRSASQAPNKPLQFERFEVTNTTASPNRTHGQVFFRSGGSSFACSGNVVDSGNRSLVWTAGHCLYSRSFGYSTDVVFVPGYRNGSAPYGQWPATELFAPAPYVQDPNPFDDFGAFTVGEVAGEKIADEVGSRGIGFNLPALQQFQSFGYPGEPSDIFDGEKLHSCISRGTARLVSGLVAMGCDMEQGSSGGGWIIRGQFINSNVMGGIQGYPNVSFGPYFGPLAQALYEEAADGVVPGPTPPPKQKRNHKMKLSMNLRKHLTLSGRLTAASGYGACGRLTEVRVLRVKGTQGTTVKKALTNNEGRYSIKVPDRPGRYLVAANAGFVDTYNKCKAVASALKQHRHR